MLQLTDGLTRIANRAVPVLTGPPILAFLPATTLGAYWLAGEPALMLVALGLPLVFAMAGAYHRWPSAGYQGRDTITGLMLRDGFDGIVHDIFEETGSDTKRSACFMIELSDITQLSRRHGRSAADAIAQQTAERIVAVLRNRGTAARLGDGRFAICLKPTRGLDLELCIQLAGALHAAIETPVTHLGSSIYLNCVIGFCLRAQVAGDEPGEWLDAAVDALDEARTVGPSCIRAFSIELQRKCRTRSDLRDEAAAALESGQIQPWYQPQISTDTGKVTGFEALARWIHPTHGIVAPDMFLPVMERAGLLERLGEVILYHALTAIKAWDKAGLSVPRVGVNFTGDELRNPRLVDKIKWELDRFELSPDRLSIEILETVVTDKPGDLVTRNIAGLAALGCRIDLDDFGTGHASLASIRRFAVSRIKIDRTFVFKADRDAQQQRLISAILTMAERLDLETLAEGVETVGEHALLAQLGCDHVQGFGIGRPMPFDQTVDWMKTHESKLLETPKIGRQTG